MDLPTERITKSRFALNQTYKQMFRFSGLTWDEGKRNRKRYIEPIRSYNPDYLEEMQGVVADGAEVTFEDILALNSRVK